MLEDQVTYLLQRYLGNYVLGLNRETLKISVWKGDVELTNMQLKPEALNSLNLPVKVKAGFLGSVKLKVPWSRLGQEPVLVYLDHIFILAEPATQVEDLSEDAVQEAKKSRVMEIEAKLVERLHQKKSEMNSSWLGSLIDTIIGNLKLSITNVHIRYEDLESNPGHPFAVGATLRKLSALTVDDFGKETFATGGALQNIQKSVELERLSLYFDSDICPWNTEKPWHNLIPSEWIQIFEPQNKNGKNSKKNPEVHSYLLKPVTGNARYIKLPSNESRIPEKPLQKAIVYLDDVTLCLSKEGYRDTLMLADNFSFFNQRLKYVHHRPHTSIKLDPVSWWKYAYRVVIDEMKKASGKFSWEHVLKHIALRKKYVTLYASLLNSDSGQLVIDNKEIDNLDRELDIEVIIQWRMLAHRFVKKFTNSDIYLKKQSAKSSWWSFGWSDSSKNEDEPRAFTEKDWERINKIIGYKEDSDQKLATRYHRGGNIFLFLFEIHMKHNASKIIDGQTCLADLSCDELDFTIKMYRESKIFDFKLGTYRLLSPNGILAESATAADSLIGLFSYKPFASQLDWSFVAKASPCYMTYLKESVDQIISFFKSSTSISQTLALETSAVVQTTLDEVRRTAQKQVTRVLKDDLRFSLDLDIAAPKITIPTKFYPDNVNGTNLLLDFGNLMLSTKDYWESDSFDEKDLYLQFNVILSDVSAFLVDGSYSWGQTSFESSCSLFPVIDKCGISMKLQQIQSETSHYPSTRLSIRMPSLWFYFSPARYHRLMQVVKIFSDDDNTSSDLEYSWSQADIEGWVSLLSWKGVGNREAFWQRRYFSLVGPFLYILEGPTSKSFKNYVSLRGKQINQVPIELTGNVDHVLVIAHTGQLNANVVEDASNLIFRFHDDESTKTWQNRLQAAVYRVSGSSPIASLSEISSTTDVTNSEILCGSSISNTLNMEKLFITGALDELKICFSCNYQNNQSLNAILLGKESPLFDFRAIGGQVELSFRENDLFIGTLLRSLEIEDKFQCESSSISRYLARSFIKSSEDITTSAFSSNSIGKQNDFKNKQFRSFSEDQFFEASESFSELTGSQSSLSIIKMSVKPPSFCHVQGLIPDAEIQSKNIDFDVTHSLDSFIKAQVVFYHHDSSLYTNIDKQVSVTLATLSFFCHRPTILAILEFVNAINILDGHDENNDMSSISDHTSRNIVDTPLSENVEEPIARGLLGKGKSRIVFQLMFNMAQTQIFLVNENGSSIATLSQNNLLTAIEVFPSSFSIKASLGNLKISDDSLSSSHSYYWVCHMRNSGGTSFVELDFSSYNSDEDDYYGCDYSIIGKLSEVRVVYLNRFVQEIASYFTGLAPSDSKGLVKLKDQVSNSEVWLTTNEIDGSSALSLDLSLTKPIIIMPRRTDSTDFMEVDVHYITVRNTFQWLQGDKSQMSAVHLETMTIRVKGINLAIYTEGISGENIIEDVKGLSFVIQRSLRDLLHQIPDLEMFVKIEELRCSLCSHEYQIITECALSNLSETPNIVPALDHGFGNSSNVLNDTSASTSSYVVELESQEKESWILLKISVSINLIALQLYSGATRETSLASIQASKVWLLYKSDSSGEGFLWSTLQSFTVTDEREGTKHEFRHAIGKHENISHFHLSYGDISNASFPDPVIKQREEEYDFGAILTMLILDITFGKSMTSISLCVQRPHLLVALDFLLAITEFFVPTVRMLFSEGGDEELLHENDGIILDHPIFNQPLTEFSLSPNKPFIVDHENFNHYVYDGKGGSLILMDSQEEILSTHSTKTVFFIGNGKRLQFKNVYIKNGEFLDSCIYLGSNSSYSVSEHDNVHLRRGKDVLYSEDNITKMKSQKHTADIPSAMGYNIELQAIGPELTFYNTSKDIGESLLLSNKLLHTKMDVFCRLILKDKSTEISGKILGLQMECNGIMVLKPFDTIVKLSNTDGRTVIHISVSDILMNLSFSIMRLFLAVEEDILAFVRMTSKKVSVSCSQFDQVGTLQCDGQTYTFWRPRAPSGFAVLGDCITPLNEPPSKGVLAVNINFVKVKRPISYKLIWPPLNFGGASSFVDNNSQQDASISFPVENDSENLVCSIWFPIAPQGYVSMGCVVSVDKREPPSSSCLCILSSLVSPCSFKDCISLSLSEPYSQNFAFWRVENSFGTFLSADPCKMSFYGKAYELRQLSLQKLNQTAMASVSSNLPTNSSMINESDQLQRKALLSSGQLFEEVTDFKLIWWNHRFPNEKKLSIWRPVIPHGMAYFGDIAVQGYESPNSCYVLRNSGDDSLFKTPIDFQMIGKLKYKNKNIRFWLPQAPLGYVSLGCIASNNPPKLSLTSSLRCIRSDKVIGDQFSDECIWNTVDTNLTKDHFSIWSVGNQASTFVIRKGFKKPPKRFALKLVDPNVTSNTSDTIIEAKVNILSAAIYDDYGGLMVPLFNMSFSDIRFTLHGRPDYMNSTVDLSLTGRSYNDNNNSWEPVIEPVDVFLRYQYDLNKPGATSQIRITSSKDLNVNISSTNVNMLLQAYSSWNNFSVSGASLRNREVVPLFYSGRSIIDVHNKTNHYILPQNKLGQNIFIRSTELKRYPTIINMSSGDNKPVKVPMSKNTLDSHLKGTPSGLSRTILKVIISKAEFIAPKGLSTGQYFASVRIISNSNQDSESTSMNQFARTYGALSKLSLTSNLLSVKWNEIFFFKVDLIKDDYTLEIYLVDMGTGEPLGFYNVKLQSCDFNPKSFWIELRSGKIMVPEGERNTETKGRIKCSFFLPVESQDEDYRKNSVRSTKPGFIQISPTNEGPWTTVRLNYSAPAACWRFGSNVVCSELTVINGTRYVNIRSLVSVTNNTDYTMNLRLKSKRNYEASSSMNNRNEDISGFITDSDEVFEIEKYDSTNGWVSYSSNEPASVPSFSGLPFTGFQGFSSFQLSDGWKIIDDWHIDNLSEKNSDGWVYAPDVEHLRWPESFSDKKMVNHARQRRWVRHRKYMFSEKGHLLLGLLKPGDTIHLPLQTLVHPLLSFFLQLRPNDVVGTHQYTWSATGIEHQKAEVSDTKEEFEEICVSALSECDRIVYCSHTNGSSSDSDSSNFLWFCLSSKPIEIGKDIHLDPIHDWKILITSPFTVTNYLPLTSEYSILRKNSTDQFIKCSQRVISPGQMIKFYSVDLQDPLYLSLNIQGWEMIHEPVLISHPHKLPSKILALRSSLSGRVVPIILEQSHDKEHMMMQCIRVYAPYWIASSKCPPLTYRFMDISNRKETRWSSLSLNFSNTIEKIIWEITDEEMIDGCTVASIVNFEHLGLSLSIEGTNYEFFGPAKDLSPLSTLDGSLDIYALDSCSNSIRLFLTSKPCPFQAVPTKVISIRPYMTFTNRIGQDIFLKFSLNDQPKCLSSSDARISFTCHGSKDSEELQVKLQDTDWSFPIKIIEENIFTIMLKTCNDDRRFLKVEIRGYEEGSRFLIVFRLGSLNGPIRIENRLDGTKISIRESCSDDSWIQIDSLSTTNFSWINFYGQKLLDICIHNHTKYFVNDVSVEENSEHCLELNPHTIIRLDILEFENVKILQFSNIQEAIDSERSSIMLVSYKGTSSSQDKIVRDTEPLELIIELGAVGTSLIDHQPKELLFLYLARVFISYSTGYFAGKASRFKLMIGQVQIDNQLPQSMMPVLLAPDSDENISHPVFKTTIKMHNQTVDGIQMYPYVYVRVTDKSWRLNIHEPIIWSLLEFYNHLHIDRLPNSSELTQVDPEIQIDLIDISEIRVKLSLETAPTQRPVGVLGIWSPILSAVGNALKIPIHLRKVVHRNRRVRKSLILSSVISRIKRDLIHNPLHLIFSLDLLGMTKSTFASLSKGFAELSTDGQFLQLRSKQVMSRRITGISDGILQGTEALAQGLAFGVSGMVRKPVESARQDGILGFTQGIGRAFLGFIVQPVSGALDFVSLTVDGISASVSKCLTLVSNKETAQRIRNPRAIHTNGVLNDYSEVEAVGQMILYLAEASRHLGFTHFFKEPSKYAWSDYYEDHFIIPNHRILLVTNRRVILLQCLAPDRMDKRPSKIIWDVPWEELMSLELAKACLPRPSHLIIHLKKFKKSECFVRIVKCSSEESQYEESQAFRICIAVRKMWRAHQGRMKTLALKVPSSQRYVHFSCDETDGSHLCQNKPMLKSRGFSFANIDPKNKIFAAHCVNFKKIWSSEDELIPRCTLCPKQVRDDGSICSIWRPICPDGYISISDSARIGVHPPTVTTIYQYSEEFFAYPVGYDLVWRNCLEDYMTPVSIWHPRAPEGFVSLGCIAVDGFEEPELGSSYCVTARITEETLFGEQAVWTAPDSYPWACHFYQVQSEALPFFALRKISEESDLTPMRISEELAQKLLNNDDGLLDHNQMDNVGSSSRS